MTYPSDVVEFCIATGVQPQAIQAYSSNTRHICSALTAAHYYYYDHRTASYVKENR